MHALRQLLPALGFVSGLARVALAEPSKPPPDMVELSKRYDVYCDERKQEVVYRNVLFKGIKKLFQKEKYNQYDVFYEFLEIEQGNGQTIFIGRSSIKKFCEHGIAPTSEAL